jgi:hypothetical protein
LDQLRELVILGGFSESDGINLHFWPNEGKYELKTLLLLAHPDDELFLLPILICESDLTVLYLTNTIRFQNSIEFLTTKFPKVHFLQMDNLLFNDGTISEEFDDMSLKLLWNFLNNGSFCRLISPNFENSHQDHDAVAAICEKIQKESNLEIFFANLYAFRENRKWLVRVRENPNSDGGKPLLYWSAGRGELIWSFLEGIVNYRREWRVWFHLGPLLLWSYLFHPRLSALSTPSLRRSSKPRWVYFTPHGHDVVQKFVLKLRDYKFF